MVGLLFLSVSLVGYFLWLGCSMLLFLLSYLITFNHCPISWEDYVPWLCGLSYISLYLRSRNISDHLRGSKNQIIYLCFAMHKKHRSSVCEQSRQRLWFSILWQFLFCSFFGRASVVLYVAFLFFGVFFGVFFFVCLFFFVSIWSSSLLLLVSRDGLALCLWWFLSIFTYTFTLDMRNW